LSTPNRNFFLLGAFFAGGGKLIGGFRLSSSGGDCKPIRRFLGWFVGFLGAWNVGMLGFETQFITIVYNKRKWQICLGLNVGFLANVIKLYFFKGYLLGPFGFYNRVWQSASKLARTV